MLPRSLPVLVLVSRFVRQQSRDYPESTSYHLPLLEMIMRDMGPPQTSSRTTLLQSESFGFAGAQP